MSINIRSHYREAFLQIIDENTHPINENIPTSPQISKIEQLTRRLINLEIRKQKLLSLHTETLQTGDDEHPRALLSEIQKMESEHTKTLQSKKRIELERAMLTEDIPLVEERLNEEIIDSSNQSKWLFRYALCTEETCIQQLRLLSAKVLHKNALPRDGYLSWEDVQANVPDSFSRLILKQDRALLNTEEEAYNALTHALFHDLSKELPIEDDGLFRYRPPSGDFSIAFPLSEQNQQIYDLFRELHTRCLGAPSLKELAMRKVFDLSQVDSSSEKSSPDAPALIESITQYGASWINWLQGSS